MVFSLALPGLFYPCYFLSYPVTSNEFLAFLIFFPGAWLIPLIAAVAGIRLWLASLGRLADDPAPPFWRTAGVCGLLLLLYGVTWSEFLVHKAAWS